MFLTIIIPGIYLFKLLRYLCVFSQFHPCVVIIHWFKVFSPLCFVLSVSLLKFSLCWFILLVLHLRFLFLSLLWPQHKPAPKAKRLTWKINSLLDGNGAEITWSCRHDFLSVTREIIVYFLTIQEALKLQMIVSRSDRKTPVGSQDVVFSFPGCMALLRLWRSNFGLVGWRKNQHGNKRISLPFDCHSYNFDICMSKCCLNA